MSLTVSCALCTPTLNLGRFDDFWEGQAVLDAHVDEHTALIPLSQINGSSAIERSPS